MHRSLLATILLAAPPVMAQSLPPASSSKSPPALQRVDGFWVEGPGYDITYGGDYEGCARRCLDDSKCLMVEYYKPEKKCNLYSTKRPRVKGGSSIIGLRE